MDDSSMIKSNITIYCLTIITLLLSGCSSHSGKNTSPDNVYDTELNSSTSNSKKMERLQFKINIDAPPEKVYKVMIDSIHFRVWTFPFSPTSYFVGTWEKGSTMQFLSKDEKGNLAGMISKVKENIPNNFISLEHYGFIQNGEEITEGEDVEGLVGALENYTFTPIGDSTEVKVDSDSFMEFKDYFLDTWPKALEILKGICEEKS